MKRNGKRFFKRGRNKNQGAKALALAKANKKKLGSAMELQTSGVDTINTVSSTTPVVTLLTAEGIGNKTMLSSVQVKGYVREGAGPRTFRVDLVLDRTPAGVAVTPLDLYGSATPVIGAYKNLQQRSRYKILRTQMMNLYNVTSGAEQYIIDWYVKLNLIAETKTNSTWTQANIQKNALYLVYWVDEATNAPTPYFNTRVVCRDV